MIVNAIHRVFTAARGRETGVATHPECVVLEAVTSGPGATLPPVRIFVGTEPAQFEAERIFVWSIEQVRDKSRVYEVYLMKNLAGFNRRWWLTGFTNYRFAIPHFAGGTGKAIYNDVDQIYLSDPAELFDRDMGGHGFLSIANESSVKHPIDTSVTLIDCARMAPLWTLGAAQRGRKNALVARALASPGLWGELEPEWNARDTEYRAGRSKLLHYTTVHLQPWRPFPHRYVYQQNPVGHVWRALARSADAADYWHFGAVRPSRGYRALQSTIAAAQSAKDVVMIGPAVGARELEILDSDACLTLIETVGLNSVLTCGLTALGKADIGPQRAVTLWTGRTVLCQNALLPTPARTERFDGILCTSLLEYLPNEDVPWVLDWLFQSVRHVVIADVPLRPVDLVLCGGLRLESIARSREWWLAQFEAASARHPGIHWRLNLQDRDRFGRPHADLHQGGRVLHDPPVVWVLAYEKPGHNTQSIGLAEALGWACEVKELRFRHLLARLHTWTQAPFGTLGASLVGLRRDDSARLAPPWPDLVIATGWRPGRTALWLRRQSGGSTRIIGLGRCAGQIADIFDAVVTCRHFHLPPHPRRIETALPINQVNEVRLSEAARRWPDILGTTPRPRVALLVGGKNEFYRLDAAIARRMALQAQALVKQAGGTVFAVTSRRTGAAATAALKSVLGDAHVHEWQRGRRENPYLAYLALADALVVTADSESMLAEAAATDKPVYIYPLPPRRLGVRRRLNAWAVNRAHAQALNRRGTIRPQEGFEYLFARLIASGALPPPRDLDGLHRDLIERGIARWFGAPIEFAPRPPLREAANVAQEIRSWLGVPIAAASADDMSSRPTGMAV